MKRWLRILVWLVAFVPAVASAQTFYAVHPNTFKAGEPSTAFLSFSPEAGSLIPAGASLIVEFVTHTFPLVHITGAGPVLSDGVVSPLFQTELFGPTGALFIRTMAPIPPGPVYSVDIQFFSAESRRAQLFVTPFDGFPGPGVAQSSNLVAFVDFDLSPAGPPGATGATGPAGPPGPPGVGIPTGTIILLARGAPTPGPGFTLVGTVIGFQAWRKD